jgi:hypothetical protein
MHLYSTNIVPNQYNFINKMQSIINIKLKVKVYYELRTTEQHVEIRIKNMMPAGQTFGICARNGRAVTAFGLSSTDSLTELGNVRLINPSQSVSLSSHTNACTK